MNDSPNAVSGPPSGAGLTRASLDLTRKPRRFESVVKAFLLGSALLTREFEFRDVEAFYRFSDVNNDPTSPDYNQPVRTRDIGSSFNHSRNDLTARIFTAELRGRWNPGGDPLGAHTIRWGVKTGREVIHDQLDEYSATLPTGTTPGKRWRRHDGAFDPSCEKPFWLIGEYAAIPDDPERVAINWYIPVLRMDAPLSGGAA